MDRDGETVVHTQILKPINQWLDYTTNEINTEFPTLVYRRVDRLAMPPLDSLSGHIRMGGSYTCFANRPWFRVRALLCEQNLFPYDLNTPHFQVRYGVFLWSKFNLYAFTDLRDPDTVYVRSRESPTRWIARLHFGEAQVTLTELAA